MRASAQSQPSFHRHAFSVHWLKGFDTYTDVHEKAAAVAVVLEGLGVVVGATAPADADEKVVDAGPAL